MAEQSRRDFLRLTAGAILIPLLNIPVSRAEDSQLPAATPDNPPAAMALKYRKTAAEAAKVPGFVAGRRCDNCLHFVPNNHECKLFQGHSVEPEGWCTAWVGKS
ncbi:MAG: high-potential iron-sulfur protein [Endozoicomonas sp.]